MKILVFLPTFNEKENIGAIIDELNRLNFDKEIIIVDDDSKDGTIDVIMKKKKETENVNLIKRTGKKGRGLAGIVGLKYFIQSDCDILVEMDADFAHHPKFIPNFLKYFPDYDVVIGSRLITSGREEDRKITRSYLSLLANFFIRVLFGIKVKDCTSGYRVFKKDLLKKLDFDNFISVNPEIVEELLYGCVLCKAKIKEIPIIYYERMGGQSKLNLKKILLVLIAIIKIRLRGKAIVLRQ